MPTGAAPEAIIGGSIYCFETIHAKPQLMPKIREGFFRRHFQTIAFLAVIAAGAAIYAHALTTNPAGFYIDESSIAYNAHLIAQTGHDEHGEFWPLYFRAFGDYKNPVYIYLLAGVFRVTGPSILFARLLSAFLGFAGAILTGLLAWRVTTTIGG